MPSDKTSARRAIAAVLRQSLRGNRALAAAMLLTIAGAVAAGVLPPLVLEKMIDALTQQRALAPGLIALYLALLATAGVFDAAKEGLITVFGQKVTHAMRSALCRKLTRLPAAYYAANEAGVITSRFVNDVDTVETLFDSGVISMLADGCKVLSILVVIFIKSRGLGVLMLLVTPLLLAFTLAVQKRMLRAQVANRVAVGQANNHIPETLRSLRMLHSLDAEQYMKNRYARYIRAGYDAVETSNFYDAVYSPVIITTSAAIVGSMMVFAATGGGARAFFGMTAGAAVAVISYVGKLFEPLESIGMEIQNIQSAVAGIARVNEFLAQAERPLPATPTPAFDKTAPAIEFAQVCFGYAADREILHNVSFSVHDRETATLTGRTGVGKSTAFKLILGMYAPTGGSVRVYGVPAGALGDAARAAAIGYVAQSFRMVDGAVRDQLTLRDATVTDAQVWRVLALVGLAQRVAQLPQKLDTPCTEALFSQGQVQLLSIARAVLRDPPVLLLDEITANLDSQTEKQVLTALHQACADRTVLSISHRVFGAAGQTGAGRLLRLQ